MIKFRYKKISNSEYAKQVAGFSTKYFEDFESISEPIASRKNAVWVSTVSFCILITLKHFNAQSVDYKKGGEAINEVIRQVAAMMANPGKEKTVYQALMEDFDNVQERFGSLPVQQRNKEDSPGGTLFWEFAKYQLSLSEGKKVEDLFKSMHVIELLSKLTSVLDAQEFARSTK